MRRLSVLAMAALTVALGTSAVWGGNQEEANRIAAALGQKFPQYNIEVAYQDGRVRLRGEIHSQYDRTAITEFVQQIPNVQSVNEMFVIAPEAKAEPISTELNASNSANSPIMPVAALQADQVAFNLDTTSMNNNYMSDNSTLPAPPSITENSIVTSDDSFPNSLTITSPDNMISDNSMPMGTIIPNDGAPNYTANYGQPAAAPNTNSYAAPQGQPMTAGQSGQPNMPNYAWPTTANYPNYSQVSYPKQYAAGAFPYIGPFYPYPQVPLGWRKVTMEWHDGYWWLDFNDGSASGPFSPLFRQPNNYR